MAATDIAPADSIITMVDGVAMVTREAMNAAYKRAVIVEHIG
jgi:hypothetical protein